MWEHFGSKWFDLWNPFWLLDSDSNPCQNKCDWMISRICMKSKFVWFQSSFSLATNFGRFWVEILRSWLEQKWKKNPLTLSHLKDVFFKINLKRLEFCSISSLLFWISSQKWPKLTDLIQSLSFDTLIVRIEKFHLSMPNRNRSLSFKIELYSFYQFSGKWFYTLSKGLIWIFI